MVKEKFTCGYCLSNNFSTVYDVKDYISDEIFNIKQCRGCFLFQSTPKLNSSQLREYYQGYRESSGKRFWQPIENIFNYWHIKRVNIIERYKKEGKVLDIGCGRGVELQLLQERGWKSFGTEFEKKLKQNLSDKKIKVFIGDFWTARYKKNFFDVVTLWHSLEHISKTKITFNEITRILKSEGILIVAVPNFNSLEQRLFRNNWFHLDVPRHRVHFSNETLSKIIKVNGFKIISKNFIAPEYDFYSFVQSGLNKIFKKQNLLYRVLNKDSSIKSLDLLFLIIQSPMIFFLAIISLIIVPLGWISKKGGTVEIIAQKE